ncbi:sodium:solute symporter family protein [Anaerobranca gottschalkii]|uniref:Solute:Na+ symporter, SSS family n=1 Tax=Anaerobranca gottschalkii DSM 13577 TaxID=1120990 RepID=A0A1I0BNQ8_9FIRM|nr:sodium:solute symporter family protein [Anaerobranca gottschalkii]SET08656.1 solute:Na+ symporter, SSS family [Anaerobranca gottschalkii DSM 13577]
MNLIKFIMLFYLSAMFLFGVFYSKKIKTLSDFLLAGRSLGFILCTSTLAATHLGGGFILGSGEQGYLTGLAGIWYGLSTGIGLILLGLFFASKLRALSLTTISDYLEKRYNSSSIKYITAILSLTAIIGILAAQVKAAEGIMVILGFNPLTGAIFATLIFIIYTAISGMWGVTITDFVQIIIAGGGIILGAILALIKIDGFSSLVQHFQDNSYLDITSIGISSITWILLPTVMYTLIGQDFIQRLFSANNKETAQSSSIAAGILLIIVSFFPVLAGMVSQILFPNLENPRAAIPLLVIEVFPPILGGIVLASIMAAVMSTADSLLCAGTSHLINDLFLKFNKGDLNDKKLVRYSSFSTLAIGLISLLIALLLPSIISALIYAYTMYTAGVFIPVIGGLIWKNGNKYGALGGMLIGATTALLGLTEIIRFKDIPVVIYSSLISLTVYIIISILPISSPTSRNNFSG